MVNAAVTRWEPLEKYKNKKRWWTLLDLNQ